MTKSEKIAQINAKLTADIAAVKAQKEQTIADYYAKVAELQRAACEAKNAANDDEPQEEQEQPVVWTDGKQHTAAIVARRILRKLPKIPYNCSVDISINHYTKDMVSIQVKGYNPNRKGNEFTDMWLNGVESEEQQAETVAGWFKETEEMFAFKPNNDHLAEPVERALDAIWGGGAPVGELNDIVDGVVRKEADNE
jgi:hypothetical protein